MAAVLPIHITVYVTEAEGLWSAEVSNRCTGDPIERPKTGPVPDRPSTPQASPGWRLPRRRIEPPNADTALELSEVYVIGGGGPSDPGPDPWATIVGLRLRVAELNKECVALHVEMNAHVVTSSKVMDERNALRSRLDDTELLLKAANQALIAEGSRRVTLERNATSLRKSIEMSRDETNTARFNAETANRLRGEERAAREMAETKLQDALTALDEAHAALTTRERQLADTEHLRATLASQLGHAQEHLAQLSAKEEHRQRTDTSSHATELAELDAIVQRVRNERQQALAEVAQQGQTIERLRNELSKRPPARPVPEAEADEPNPDACTVDHSTPPSAAARAGQGYTSCNGYPLAGCP